MPPLLVFIPELLRPPTSEELAALGIKNSVESYTWIPAFRSPLDSSPGFLGALGALPAMAIEPFAQNYKWYQAVGYQFACREGSPIGSYLISKIGGE